MTKKELPQIFDPSRQMKVAFITSQAFSIANFRGALIREMVARGAIVYTLAPDYDNDTRAAVLALGAIPVDFSMSRAGMNPLQDVVDLIRLSKQLRTLNLDSVFTYFIKPVIYGGLAAWLAAVPKRFSMIEGAGYVFTEEEAPTLRRRLLRNFVVWLYRLSLSQANQVFMLNHDDKNLFINEGMVCAKKVQVINGIGLELEHFQMVEAVRQPVCFILIARLIRQKGIYEYIEAARKVKTLHPEVRFILLGDVDLNPSSIRKSEVETWVAEGIIEWPGQVSDVRTWIAQASVFVLPSYYREGLPRSTQEAMALGRPIITTDTPGCKETVEQGVNGFMVPIRDPEALSNAMLRFINQPELINFMGEKSRRMAEEKFNVHKINSEILKVMGISSIKEVNAKELTH